MTEDDMKTKECPQHVQFMVIMQIEAGKAGQSEEAIAAMGKFGLCSVSACAMWEPEYEEERMDCSEGNYPEGTLADSEKNGWIKTNLGSKHNRGAMFIKYNKLDEGDCGLKTKENGCFYPG